ncbi:uncharacterized protein [Watersipora subatra]|uniref:uncharacterized protein isoform X2 n=1 Tax=Watersipora subatra TaxID=2589382 RepID=UPI00355C3A68
MGHEQTATLEELKRLQAKAPFARYEMADFRFKGYVNDFMVSPRNPITQQSFPHVAGAQGEKKPAGTAPQLHPPRNPPTQSADLKARKEESDRDIAIFKQEKLQEMIAESQLKREKEGFRPHNEVATKPKPQEKPFMRKEEQGNSAVDLALNDTERRIQKLKQEMQELEAATAKSIPYIDPANGPLLRPKPAHAPFAFYDPWGKGQGNPRRRANGDQERYPAIKERGIVPTVKEISESWSADKQPRRSIDKPPSRGSAPPAMQAPPLSLSLDSKTMHDTGTGLKVESKFGGSGEPVKTYSGSNRTRFPTTMRKDIYGNTNMTEMDGYNPFKGKAPGNPEFFPYGKPGGGAPLRDNNGKSHAQRRNVDFAHERDSSAEISQRRRAADEYLHELKREMAEQRRARNEANVELRAPKGKVGFPKRDPETGAILNHHHKFSDVTRSQNGIPESKMFAGLGEGNLSSSLDAKNYHNELSKIAEERHKMRQLERVRDTQEELKHGETWNDFWGKPGAGAPNSKDQVFKRAKFDNTLHGRQDKNGLVIIKNTPQGIHQLNPDHYSKSTIQSNHVNMFELPVDRHRRERQVDYHPSAPFATALPN